MRKSFQKIAAVPGMWWGVEALFADPSRRESVQLCAIGLCVARATYADLLAMLHEHGLADVELFNDELQSTLPVASAGHIETWNTKVSAKLKARVSAFVAKRHSAQRERAEKEKMDAVARQNEEGFRRLMQRINADADAAMKRMDRRFAAAKREVRKVVASHAH